MNARSKPSTWIWTLAGLALAACGPAPAQDAARDISRPQEALLAEFRVGRPEVTALDSGTPSRDALVQRWVAAVASADTAAVRQLLLTRAEFAWLLYPTSAQALPPYELPPALMWDMLSRQSAGGMQYVFRRWAGRELQLAGYDCGTEPVREGENLLHGPCILRVVANGSDTISARLTGPIVERGGVFKFVSYTNDLD